MPLPNNTTQDAATYKSNIDESMAAAATREGVETLTNKINASTTFNPEASAQGAIHGNGPYGGGVSMDDNGGYGVSWMEESGAAMYFGVGNATSVQARLGIRSDTVVIKSQNEVYEGGHLTLEGAGAYADMDIDIHMDHFRIWKSTYAKFLVFDTQTGALSTNSYASIADCTINGVTVGRGGGNISGNTAVGYTALENNTTGTGTVALGYGAANGTTTGDYNVALGTAALFGNSTGDRNVAIGQNALYFSGSSKCTAVGSLALNGGGSLLNSTGLGYNAEVTGDNQVQLGDSSTTTYVYGTVQNRSDLRDKADVRDTVLGLDFIQSLRPVDYKLDMRDDYKTSAPERPIEPERVDPFTLLEPVSPVIESFGEDTEAYDTAVNNYEASVVTYNAALAIYEEAVAAYDAAMVLYEAAFAEYQVELVAWSESVKMENLTHDGSKKRNRYHHGLIAHEVKAVIENSGVDFGGYQDHSIAGGEDVLSIGYDELIAPMIKAIQELKAEFDAYKEAHP